MTHMSRGFSVNIAGFLFPNRNYRHGHIQQIRVSRLFGAIAIMCGMQQCVSQQKTLVLKTQNRLNPACSGWVNHWGWFNVSTGPGLGKETCLLSVLVMKRVNFHTAQSAAVSCCDLALIAEFQGRIWVCFQAWDVESEQRFCKTRERDRLALWDSESVHSWVWLVLFNETC